MGEEKERESAGSSSRHSSSRREKEDRHRHRDRDAKHRHDDDRRHSKREDREKEDDRHRHRDHHRSHRSGHHYSDSRDRHREREGEEDRSERKRRRRDDEKDEERRHDSRSHHRKHRDEVEFSSRRNRSDRDHHNSERAEVEKQPATDFIPTSASLDLTSHAPADTDAFKSGTTITTSDPASTLKRDDWMLTSHSSDPFNAGDASYFSTLGRARVKQPRPEKPDPEKLKISSRELNTQLVEGKTVDQYSTPSGAETKPQYGGPGYQWRMMKLKRTLEAAEEEGRKPEEVALERYASLADFEEALEERRALDGKGGEGNGKGRDEEREDGGRGRGTPTLQSVARRSYMLASGRAGGEGEKSGTDSSGNSRPGSRQGFKRPGESSGQAAPRPPRNIGFETPSSKPTTPSAIPSVFTPVIDRPAATQAGVVLDDGSSDPDRPILTADQLNKLQAKILKAELMGDDSQLTTLREEYERESARAKAHNTAVGDKGGAFAPSTQTTTTSRSSSNSAGVLVEDGTRELQVLPTLDARGRMYDIGSLSSPSSPPAAADGRKKKLKGRDKFEARDPRTGQIIRYSADDDSTSLSDLVRQEKFSAGSSSHKNPDAELAANIITDAGFSSNLEDQDEEAHRYAKKKMRSDALKRQFAINDFARTKKALDTCRFCWQDEGAKSPRVTVVSSGYRAYLAIPDHEGVVEGEVGENVLIVPMQHHLSLLEAEEETWDEIRNFQKCLVQMAAGKGKKVVFYEMVVSLKPQAHSYIEAVILPSAAMDLLPGVFKESLRSVGGEFSTHRKVTEFTAERPFRNALVPNLPYFAVSWDYRWSSGYGHVIENMDGEKGGAGKEDGGDAYDVGEMAAGGGTGDWVGGKFDANFARDVIRGVLEDLDAEGGDEGGGYVRGFGRSKRRSEEEKRRVRDRFRKDWDAVDWTKMLQTQ